MVRKSLVKLIKERRLLEKKAKKGAAKRAVKTYMKQRRKQEKARIRDLKYGKYARVGKKVLKVKGRGKGLRRGARAFVRGTGAATREIGRARQRGSIYQRPAVKVKKRRRKVKGRRAMYVMTPGGGFAPVRTKRTRRRKKTVRKRPPRDDNGSFGFGGGIPQSTFRL